MVTSASRAGHASSAPLVFLSFSCACKQYVLLRVDFVVPWPGLLFGYDGGIHRLGYMLMCMSCSQEIHPE